MIRFYILDDEHNVTEVDLDTWGDWLMTHERHVGDTELFPLCRISTVFLGLDHDWTERGPPLIFETMVFNSGTDLDEVPIRCTTWLQAIAQHDQVVATVRSAVGPMIEVEQ